ncbi:uncharacterized protein LOC114732734 [Neltuma alba]|uniref:uncharacterized protein LOC114732734 n=1 Tax=Neltuma alba TaxID=207710 RepID=UPI0010A4937B|nr:uncharacterized protein LOC114732734 [Prosopis alba]
MEDDWLLSIQEEVETKDVPNYEISEEEILRHKKRICVPNNEEIKKTILEEAYRKWIRSVAYQIVLPPHLPSLHDKFHTSQLKKYHPNLSHVIEPEEVELRDNLTYSAKPERILDVKDKQLRNKAICLVKVFLHLHPGGGCGGGDDDDNDGDRLLLLGDLIFIVSNSSQTRYHHSVFFRFLRTLVAACTHTSQAPEGQLLASNKEVRMDILISVVGKIVELTVEPIGRQVGYLLCYRNNLKELKDQVDEMEATKKRIDREVEDEKRNGKEIQADVLKWQEGVIETLEEVEKLCEDEPHATIRCWKWSFPNFKSQHQIGRRAKEMLSTIVEMKGKGNFDKGVGYVPHLNIINNFSSPIGSGMLESRNSVKKEVVLSLKDPKVSKIGVYGIDGVGKTTLVKEVAKQVEDDKLFDVVVVVTISQTNLETIQEEIAEQLGLQTLKKMTSSIGRANLLCERIKKEKTILIILEDLREKIDVENLGIPSFDVWGKINSEKVGVPQKDDYKGCKLLLTSTSQDILQQNETQKNFCLQLLNGEESWSLFETMVGDVVKDTNFQIVATQVVERCGGLPVLIVTNAKALKYNKDIHFWKDTLNNLKRDNSMLSSLEFNLNRLEDEAKKVFLLCGVHGTSILFNDLLKYAIGLGIFKCINTIEDARIRLYRIIGELKASCLLVDDDARAGMIEMHNSFRGVANSIASTYVFSKSNAKLQDWPKKGILESCTQIILQRCCIQKLPERLDCPRLTFLLINSRDNRTLEIPDSFFEGMRKLEALDLTGIIMSSLPISLLSLTKLKTLCLDSCSLKDMTGIGALKKLEILSLVHSSIEEFPSEIKRLTKLRMLDLSKSGIGATLPNILCKLAKIEELYIGNATVNWEVESSSKQKRNASLTKLSNLTGLTALEIQVREAWLLPKDIPFDNLERYKVIIGDIWEWSSNRNISRLLKVKLDTSIHWERGIKTLIKKVDDLYLDRVSGISNVLFELNGEGFPLLKHFHIQNNDEIQHIIDSVGRNRTHILFPKLETLVLHNLSNLVKICNGPIRDNFFAELKVVKVKSCHQLIYLFSISMVKAFSQLVEIEVSECSTMKNIVLVESEDGGKTIDDKIDFLPLRSLTLQHLPAIDDFFSLRTEQNSLSADTPTPFFSAKVKLSKLETLKLSTLHLKKIWDDNQSSAPYLFQNLANLTVEDCSGLKCLFSSSMVGRLSNLKQLEISKCDMMEEIIATEEINGVPLEEVLFPKLEAIIIKDMQNLKMIWHPVLASNSLTCFKKLEVKNCEKIEKIFPEYMNRAFAILETLKVEGCMSVKEIFQLGVNADDTTQLKYITLLRLPELKQIWSRGSQSSTLCFKNLQVVRVEDCGDLEYLFPFSIAMTNLPLLEQIIIKRAKMIKEIVSNKEEPLDDPVKFVFNQLTSVVLWCLPNLQGFCAGNHSLSCASLKKLSVYDCGKLKLFKTQVTSSQERLCHDNLLVSMKQPLLTLEEVIDNLEMLVLNNEDASMILRSEVPRDQFCKLKVLVLYKLEDAQGTSPYWFLQNISSLEWLAIQENSFKVIFPNEKLQDESGDSEIKTRLKKLTLYKLNELQHICREGFQLDPVLDVLERLYVDLCSNLKSLVPSSVTFNQLSILAVHNCNGLIYLITSSTARSLVKLTELIVRECDSIEQIVVEEGRESTNEITFNCLKVLRLESLPKLKIFCSSSNCGLKLPVLEKLVIRQCARMESFSVTDTSAPLLREILTYQQDVKWFCEGDINSTLNKMFHDKLLLLNVFLNVWVAFRSFEHLELSQYPELADVWYSHVKHEMFVLSNLDKLEVSECDSLEALIELPNMNEGEMENMSIHLKVINLSGLPELKHIWSFEKLGEISSDNSQGFRGTTNEGDIHHQRPMYSAGQVLFSNLETIIIKDMPKLKTIWHPFFTSNSISSLKTMHVSKCEKLDKIFPSYMERAFRSLETLIVIDCNSVEVLFEISCETGSAEDTAGLQKLTLLRLSKLKQIWSTDPKENLPFHKLLHVCVENCNNLEYLFPLSIAMHAVHIEDITIKNAGRMKQIVSEEEGILSNPVRFKFDRLTSLVLWNLNEMEGFFARYHSLLCPLLRELDIRNSGKVKLFKTQHWSSQGRVSMQQSLSISEEVAFHSLEHLELPQYLESGDVWYSNVKLEMFGNLKILVVHKCDFLSKVLFPVNLLQVLSNLEKLEVSECGSLEAIFDVKALDKKAMESKEVSRLKNLTLLGLPSLKHIWNREAGDIINFENLQIVKVEKCQHLKSLFSVSLCQDLRQLEVLHIDSCGVEEIVSTEEQLEEPKFDFPQLKVLKLFNLTQLTNFYPKKYILECPSLKSLNVRGCKEMRIFAFDHLNSQPLWKDDINLQIKQALFHIRKVSQSLQELPLNEEDTMRILKGNYEKNLFKSITMLRLQYFRETPIKFLDDLIRKFPATTTLQARCSSFETLFPSKEIGHCSIDSLTHIKTLWLFQLEQLERIWNADDSASHPLVQNLEHLYIWECSGIIRLAPPSASFKNLISLEVKGCNGLMYFMTSCTAKTLVHLTSLSVINCGMLEEVVITDEGELEEEITFESLKCLKLTCLSSLKSFCFGEHTLIFPSLMTLTVIGCNKMQNFSSGVIIAPFLKLVVAENGEKRWKEDLNTTIMQLVVDKATNEGVEGDCNESSSINIQSSQTYQKSESTSRALTSKVHGVKSKANEIVDSGKQEIHKLPTPHTDINTQKISEITETPLDQASQNKSSPTKVDAVTDPSPSQGEEAVTSSNQDEATGIQEIHESKRRFSVHDVQNVWSPTMVYDTGRSDDTDIILGNNLSYKTTNSVMAENPADLALSQASKAASSSTTLVADICTSFKEVDGLLPYLEAGVMRHPQVLNWFNTKPRRAFTALFTEVTSILRTTRRRDLKKDHQNYIEECCAALEAVGFDASWLNYVYGCIESCGDGDELRRKLEEIEAKVSTLRNELASAEASLVSLRDEASRLDNFIES